MKVLRINKFLYLEDGSDTLVWNMRSDVLGVL